jgi:hypothetical protein
MSEYHWHIRKKRRGNVAGEEEYEINEKRVKEKLSRKIEIRIIWMGKGE